MRSTVRCRRIGVILALLLLLVLPGLAGVERGGERPLAAQEDEPVPHVEITLYRGRVAGWTEPDGDVEIWRVDDNGNEVGRWHVDARSDGSFLTELVLEGSGDARVVDPLEPGQRLFVDFTGGGDPMVFDLPEMTVNTDPLGDTISGTAPPGSRLEVTVGADDDAQVVDTDVTAEVDWEWHLDLSDTVDLIDGQQGTVTLLQPGGHRIRLDWVAPRVYAGISTGRLTALGPQNRRYDIRLLSPDGTVASHFEGRSPLDGYRLRSSIGGTPEDVLGRPIRLEPGAKLVGTFGDEVIDFTIPRVDAVLDPAANQIRGSSSAAGGSKLSIRILDEERGQTELDGQLDPDGHFVLDVAAGTRPWTLMAGDRALVSLSTPGGRTTRYTAIPGIRLHLDGPRVEVILPARDTAEVVLRRDDQTVHTEQIVANRFGDVDVPLVVADQPWEISVGDEFILRPGDVSDSDWETTSLRVPNLAVGISAQQNSMFVCTPSVAGRFSLHTNRDHDLTPLIDPVAPCTVVNFATTPIADPPNSDPEFLTLRAGDAVTAQHILPTGHIVQRRGMVPRYHVQLEHNVVCVTADPRKDVQVEVAQPERALATGQTDAYGRVRLPLRAAMDAPRLLQTGETLEGDVDGELGRLEIPPLDLTVDWEDRQVQVTGQPGARVELHYPGQFTDCFGEYGAPRAAEPGLRWTTGMNLDEDGRASPGLRSLWNDERVSLRDGLVLDQITASGHRVYRRIYPLILDAFLGTRRVVVTAPANESVDIDLVRGDGAVLGEIRQESDHNGHLDHELKGADPAILPGRRLVATSGGLTATLDIPPLDFDWSTSGGLDGHTEPSAPVSVTLRLSDGRIMGVPRIADEEGRFTFRESELPDSEDWSFADVAGVRAMLEIEPWHRAIREWPSGPVPTPNATIPTRTPTPTPSPTATNTPVPVPVYMPWTVRAVRR